MAGVLKAKVGGQWVPIVGSGMTAEVARWNSAWGIVAMAQITTNQTVGSAVADVTGLTTTFTAVAGRRYLMTAYLLPSSSVNGDTFTAYITDASNNFTTFGGVPALSTSASTLSVSVVETGLAGTVTRKVRAYRALGSGTVTLSANAAYPNHITVEDVGPVIYNAAPAPIGTPTAWTTLAYINGWGTLPAGSFSPLSYRMVGDVVQMRGVISRSTALTVPSSVQVSTLPVGFRPSPTDRIFSCNCAGTAGYGEQQARVSINSLGEVYVLCGSASQVPHTYTSLDNIQFSVTP